jgi:diguanylate cyclase (GGDEF)-like protein
MSDLLETLRAHFPLDDGEETHLSRKLIQQATTDRLTGVAKREHLIDLAQVELHRARRYHRSLSVVMFDVDYQRDKEETVSCLIVDQVLFFAAECCKQNLRESDILGRFSESEFVILLPETNLIEAQIVARRIGESIVSGHLITDRGPITLVVNMSANTNNDEIDNVDLLFSLCEAKKNVIEPKYITDVN